MKRNLLRWQIIGFALTSVVGSLSHFLYDLTNKSILIAPFSAVNESTWEHMKILFFPMFLFALIQRRYINEYDNFWCVKLAGTAAGLALIPILFYTYNGVFGRSSDWVNIGIFFVSSAAAFYLETFLFKRSGLQCKKQWLALALICIIGVLFAVFTFAAPHIPIFKDPITGKYGINV